MTTSSGGGTNSGSLLVMLLRLILQLWVHLLASDVNDFRLFWW